MTEQAPSSFSPMARLAPIEGSEKGLNHHAVRHLFEKTSQLCLTSYGPPARAMGLRRRARSATKSKQLTKLQGGLGWWGHGVLGGSTVLGEDIKGTASDVEASDLNMSSSKKCITESSVDEVAQDTCHRISFTSLPNSASIRLAKANKARKTKRITVVATKAQILGKQSSTRPRTRVLLWSLERTQAFQATQLVACIGPCSASATGRGRTGEGSWLPPMFSNQAGRMVCRPFIKRANKAVTRRESLPDLHLAADARRSGLERVSNMETPGSTSPSHSTAALRTTSTIASASFKAPAPASASRRGPHATLELLLRGFALSLALLLTRLAGRLARWILSSSMSTLPGLPPAQASERGEPQWYKSSSHHDKPREMQWQWNRGH